MPPRPYPQPQETYPPTAPPPARSVPHYTTPLLRAIGAGDTRQVSQLIRSGVNINAADANGWTPLHFAAELKTELMVAILVRAGAHLEARNSFQETPLLVAAITENNIDMVYKLVGLGADIHARDNEGHGVSSYLTPAQFRLCEDIVEFDRR